MRKGQPVDIERRKHRHPFLSLSERRAHKGEYFFFVVQAGCPA